MAQIPTSNQALFDAVVRNQIRTQRVADGDVAEVLALLQASDAELLAALPGLIEQYGDAKAETLIQQVHAIRQPAFDAVDEAQQQRLDVLTQAQAGFAQRTLQGVLPLEHAVAEASARAVREAASDNIQGVPLKGWLNNISASDSMRVASQVKQGYVAGETVDQIVRRVRGTKENDYKDGVLDITRRNAEALVRTAVNDASNQAQDAVWQANEDILDGLRWTSTLDGRTSSVCRARDGTVYPMKSGPRPPAHFNCRSVMVPEISGMKLVGDRPAVTDTRTRKQRETDFRKEAQDEAGDAWKGMSKAEKDAAIKAKRAAWTAENVGQVDGEETYDSWLRRQSQGFQEEVLGKTKAKMFRDGLTLDKFVDSNGKELTIDQLKALQAGDTLNVVQPSIGLKAKSYLQQGMTVDQTLEKVLEEYPDAKTTKASIASYKSELNKVGALDELKSAVPSTLQKKVSSIEGIQGTFEAGLPKGLQQAVGSQWLAVADDLDGTPGVYAHYQAGKGVTVSAEKLSKLSAGQAQQVLSHEFGHMLHKQHGVMMSPDAFQAMKAVAAQMTSEQKKLYAYYLGHVDELTAEVYAQALSPSPLTSQGLNAQQFKELFAHPIDDAKKAIAAKFPEMKVEPVKAGPPIVPGQVAGKPTSVGSYAKALIQQGLDDQSVLDAVKAEFPDAKTSKASLASYKSELKKQGLVKTPGQGPSIEPVTKEMPVQAPPPPPVSLGVLGAPVQATMSPATVKAAATKLFQAGILDNRDAKAQLIAKFPQNDGIKLSNVATWKSQWKKTASSSELKAAATQEATINAEAAKAAKQAKDATTGLKGASTVDQKGVDQVLKWLQDGYTAKGAKDNLMALGFVSAEEADAYIAEAVKQSLAKASAASPGAAAVASPVTVPKLATVKMGGASTKVLGLVKDVLLAEKDPTKAWEKAVGAMSKVFGTVNQAGAEDMYHLAKYQLHQADKLSAAEYSKLAPGKVSTAPSAGSASQKPSLPQVDMTPTHKALDPREGFPPPPRFSAEQRAAGIRKWAGDPTQYQDGRSGLNARQKSLGLEEVSPEEYAAVKAYTGSAYRAINDRLRAGGYGDDLHLQAFVEAGQRALDKMPKRKGEMRRGMNLGGSDLQKFMSAYQPGTVVQDNSFVSTAFGGGGFGGNIELRVMSKTGVDVSQVSFYKRENEVLFAPGTKFKVTKVQGPGDGGHGAKHVIYMDEV